jgi:excisionase family DNA binding protein
MHDVASEQKAEERVPELWHTPSEIAERLKLSEQRVSEILERGEIEHVLVGGERRVSELAFVRYLDAVARRPPKRRSRARVGAWLTLGGLASALLAAGLLNAAEPALGTSEVVPYHGYLEEDGQPVEARKYFTFCLSRNEADTACVWTENQVLDVSGGQFSAELGRVASLDSVLGDPGSLYLSVTVDGVTGADLPAGTPIVLAGKQLLGSAPFARRGSPGESFVVDGTLSSGALSVGNSASVGQNATVGNQITAKQLNLNGRITFANVQRFCIFATSCPVDWADNGSSGFIIDTAAGGTCPYTLGGVYSGTWRWCHPRLCCS